MDTTTLTPPPKTCTFYNRDVARALTFLTLRRNHFVITVITQNQRYEDVSVWPEDVKIVRGVSAIDLIIFSVSNYAHLVFVWKKSRQVVHSGHGHEVIAVSVLESELNVAYEHFFEIIQGLRRQNSASG